MFERFTREAREAVEGAVGHAERTGSAVVSEEHVLLALAERAPFTSLGVDTGALAAALAENRRRGGLSKADEEALAGLGIDLTEIVSRVEATHGAGALAGPAPRTRRWSNHRRFTAGAKSVLEQSLRVALGRRDRRIGTEHLLLALIARPGAVGDVLADHGVTYERVEHVLAGPEA
ncbi:Clp protease N-terminal domain-containing protein [Streptomyces sp. NPDC101132]|uniref:Clp protease N-terminal domain-containing protein n=1 Tax=Streptomyces sp. NPDC101132 TaxID=3366110 RepID=UPI00382AC2C9